VGFLNTTAQAKIGKNEPSPARVEVELDIFSGMPNPTWVLTGAEAASFLQKLAELPPASPTKLSGNLGYRGLIVQVTQGADTQLIHIQNGTVHIAKGAIDFYTRDDNRKMERWLVNTGKAHLKNELLQVVEREFQRLP
jgi:hypothetical protein